MPERPRTVLRVGWQPLAYNLPYYVSIRDSLFESNGFEVKTMKFDNSNAMAEALAVGSIDLATSVSTQALLAVESNRPGLIKILYVHISSAAKPGDFLLTKKDSQINNTLLLEGHNIGYHTGSTMLLYAKAVLIDSLGFKNVNLIPIPPEHQRAALLNGTVDALFAYDPIATQLIQEDSARILISAPKNWIMQNMPSGCYGL